MPKQGDFPPLPRESCLLEVARLAFYFFYFFYAHQRGNSQPALFSRDVMAAVRASRTSSLLGRYHPAGIPLLPDSNYSCSHDVTAHPKQSSRFEGFPTRAHVLCSSITRTTESQMTSPAHRTRAISRASRGTRDASGKPLRTLCEQNVRCRPHGALYTGGPRLTTEFRSDDAS